MYPAKVLVVHNRYQQRGGEDGVFEREVALLRSKGHEVIEYLETNDGVGPTNAWKSGFEAIWSRETTGRLRQILRQEQPDIAHFHNTFARISPAAYYACRQSGVPVVQTLHNFRIGCLNACCLTNDRPCERCLPQLIPVAGILKGCYRGSSATSAAMAAITTSHKMLGTYKNQVDAYIALTEFARGIHVRSGLPGHKLHVKPNFSEGQPESGGTRSPFALFVGRLCPEKGVTPLIDAWRKAAPALPLKIVGDGPSAPEVAAAAAEIPGVEWLGLRNHAEVMALMRSAQFLVMPSLWYENFPLCIVEAFSVGLPCVVSQLGSMQEIVEHGQTGLHFRAGDAADLAAQALWMASHPDQCLQMGRTARVRFEQLYTPEHNYRRLIEIYQHATLHFQQLPQNNQIHPARNHNFYSEKNSTPVTRN